MNIRLVLLATIFSLYGTCPSESFANDNRVLLRPVAKYSYCTPYYGATGHSLGVVGSDWVLTFEVPEERFSGDFQTNMAYFYRGPDMYKYIGKPAGPVRPPIPKTKQYTKIELAGLMINIKRIKIYDKVMGPIEVVVSDFMVNNQQFHILGPVNIFCIGPLP